VTDTRNGIDALSDALADYSVHTLVGATADDEVFARAVADKSSRHTWRSAEDVGPADGAVAVISRATPSPEGLRSIFVGLERRGVAVAGLLAATDGDPSAMRLGRSLGYRMKAIAPANGGARDVHVPTRAGTARSRELRDRVDALLASAPLAAAAGIHVRARRERSFAAVAEGFAWSGPQAPPSSPEALVEAAVGELASSLARCPWFDDDLRLEARTLGEVAACLPKDLDWRRFGVLASRFDGRIGVGLPDDDGIVSEIEQLERARRAAGCHSFDPAELYRFAVTSVAAEGPVASAWRDPGDAALALLHRARHVIATGESPPMPLPESLEALPVDGVAVTVYVAGSAGCSTSWRGSLTKRLDEAARGAAADARIADRLAAGRLPSAISISLAHSRRPFETTPATFARNIRLGHDTVVVEEAGRVAVLLESVPIHYSWDRAQLVAELREKSGRNGRRPTWSAYSTESWVAGVGVAARLEGGYPSRDARADDGSPARGLAQYIRRRITPDGLPEYAAYPVTGTRIRAGSLGRRLHALQALGEAGAAFGVPEYVDVARRGFEQCLERIEWQPEASLDVAGDRAGPSSWLQLLHLAARIRHPRAAELAPVAATLAVALPRADGRIAAPGARSRFEEDHDFLPGLALAALLDWNAFVGREHAVPIDVDAHLAWYRLRAEHVRTWGMVGWLPHACVAAYRASGDARATELAFLLADWALDNQLERTGAFVTDLDLSAPSFHTAYVAESVAGCRALAAHIGDSTREDRYARSCERALAFMTRLTIRPADMYCMREADAVGGVRLDALSSEVRIDYVSHTLFAYVRTAEDFNARG
jgi:AMMECR1